METDFPPLNESQPACGGLAGDHIKYEGLNLILMPPNASRLVVSSPVPWKIECEEIKWHSYAG